jgi:hypothetical protein
MLTLAISAVQVGLITTSWLYLYFTVGVLHWRGMVTCWQDAETDDFLMHLSMAGWGWHRRWKALAMRAQFVALWPAWMVVGWVRARARIRS